MKAFAKKNKHIELVSKIAGIITEKSNLWQL